jgi:hypothetical protein
MRKSLFASAIFLTLFAGSKAPAIIQRPLRGELAPVKLALNQPLKVWQRLLGNGDNVENENAP